MKITNEMLQAAMKKAVEAGLLPRNAYRENMTDNQELIRFILKAALDVSPSARQPSGQEHPLSYRPAGNRRGAQNGKKGARVSEYSFRSA
ncbi:hypothetical protein GCM10027343_31070 [Noviherbaspirillum agri]